MNQLTLKLKSFSPPMRQAARLLIANEQGGPLGQMRISPDVPAEWKTLGSIVIHTVAVLNSNSRSHLILPFVNMLNNPASLTVSILMLLRLF